MEDRDKASVPTPSTNLSMIGVRVAGLVQCAVDMVEIWTSSAEARSHAIGRLTPPTIEVKAIASQCYSEPASLRP